MRILFACSTGGHLAQLHLLRPWWERHQRTWVTFDDPQARSLLADEAVIPAFHPTARNAWRNLRLAIRVIRAERPDVLVSDGAGVAFPFFLAGRLLGVRTVYLEVYDRIAKPTLTGRLCYPLADLFCVQWPGQQALYPKSQVIGCLL